MCNLRIVEGQQYQADGGRWATVTSVSFAANGRAASSDASEDLMHGILGMFTSIRNDRTHYLSFNNQMGGSPSSTYVRPLTF